MDRLRLGRRRTGPFSRSRLTERLAAGSLPGLAGTVSRLPACTRCAERLAARALSWLPRRARRRRAADAGTTAGTEWALARALSGLTGLSRTVWGLSLRRTLAAWLPARSGTVWGLSLSWSLPERLLTLSWCLAVRRLTLSRSLRERRLALSQSLSVRRLTLGRSLSVR